MIAVAAGILVVLLVLPLISLVLRIPAPALIAAMRGPVVRHALGLSLITTSIATLLVVVLGVPAVYFLVMCEFRGKRIIETLAELPIVLPPTVAGLGLLLAFGRAGLAGRVLTAFGISLPFTTAAVVLAQLFVATPFFISAALAGLRNVEHRYRDVAVTLRASPGHLFRRVLLPLALPSIAAGVAMSWARALGEFGATITFAGNLIGRTQTMPLAVYSALQSDLDSAVAVAVVLLFFSFTILLVLRYAPWGAAIGGRDARRRHRQAA